MSLTEDTEGGCLVMEKVYFSFATGEGMLATHGQRDVYFFCSGVSTFGLFISQVEAAP